MKNILIYLPRHAVAMSATLVKELCWVATAHTAQQESIAVDPGQYVRLVSADGEPVDCFSGNQLSVDIGLDEVVAANDPVDALFLCAFWGAPQQIIEENRALLPWLNRLNDQAVPIAAVSNGPFFLAEAGLLDSKVATVYPPVADQFQRRYPPMCCYDRSGVLPMPETCIAPMVLRPVVIWPCQLSRCFTAPGLRARSAMNSWWDSIAATP